jgi:hypothetical protein
MVVSPKGTRQYYPINESNETNESNKTTTQAEQRVERAPGIDLKGGIRRMRKVASVEEEMAGVCTGLGELL